MPFHDLGSSYYDTFNREHKIKSYLKRLQALGWQPSTDNLKKPLKKPMDNPRKVGYNVLSDPACHSKEVVTQMASQRKTVKGNLFEDRGTWVVRARVSNPLTGKNEQRSKSTGFKVKDCTKRKAEKAMEAIVATWEQVAGLLEASETEEAPIHAAVTMAVCYGLRRSEICGLRWADIDFDSGKLYVRNTVVQNVTLKIEAERTKTAKRRRTIDLIGSTVPYLLRLKQMQARSGVQLDKVCVWPDGKEVRPDYITHATRKLMEKYGLEHIRVHDLRHTAGTLLSTRATMKQVQEFLRHEDISTAANTYVHLLDEDRKAASNIMDSILKKSGFCSEKCSEPADGQ